MLNANDVFGAMAMLDGDSHRILDIAEKESNSLGHDFLGCEHVLLGFLSVAPSLVVDVLRRIGTADELLQNCRLQFVRGRLEDRLPRSNPDSGQPLSSALQATLIAARASALGTKREVIDSSNLLEFVVAKLGSELSSLLSALPGDSEMRGPRDQIELLLEENGRLYGTVLDSGVDGELVINRAGRAEGSMDLIEGPHLEWSASRLEPTSMKVSVTTAPTGRRSVVTAVNVVIDPTTIEGQLSGDILGERLAGTLERGLIVSSGMSSAIALRVRGELGKASFDLGNSIFRDPTVVSTRGWLDGSELRWRVRQAPNPHKTIRLDGRWQIGNLSPNPPLMVLLYVWLGAGLTVFRWSQH
jgi:ClpA/ClpB-like protein